MENTQSIDSNVIVLSILSIIETIYDVDIETLKSRKKHRNYAEARHLSIYYIRRYTKYSTTVIGNFFNRHHSSVIHATKVINNLLDSKDKTIITVSNKIMKLINSSNDIRTKDSVFINLLEYSDIEKKKEWMEKYVNAY